MSGKPDSSEGHALDEKVLRELMLRYQAGELSAAEELVRRVSPALYGFLRGPVATRHHAKDLLQQCWLEVHRARHTFRPEASVLPWLYAIARHVRRDAWRRGCKGEQLEVGFDDTAEEALAAFQYNAVSDVQQLLERLPEAQRQAVTLLKLHGLSLDEFAVATSCTVGAAKQRAHRAYEALRRMLNRRASRENGE